MGGGGVGGGYWVVVGGGWCGWGNAKKLVTNAKSKRVFFSVLIW